MKPLPLLLCVLAVAAVQPARADYFRCGNLLVGDGDTAAKVRERCGIPSKTRVERKLVPAVIWRDGRPIRVLPGEGLEVTVEFWTYNFGPKRLMQEVRLEEGVVKEIKTLGYGH